ncbi:hypothetical protein BD626DRAFT_486752 [Schizophyllum amplum]|uniref:Uncharacterized protein n=1 Tax=Schizophyllum amplum TaxID=97359 RepID=A0A550CMW5_9AGAR|nr:hypothetical protein BD626DRAFT_486752 [Auriculariopsis ampla]
MGHGLRGQRCTNSEDRSINRKYMSTCTTHLTVCSGRPPRRACRLAHHCQAAPASNIDATAVPRGSSARACPYQARDSVLPCR